LTGHLVFTTLHTNSATVAFTRLTEMEIEPFLVSSSTIGVVAQRLARRLCPNCREPYDPDPETQKDFGLPAGTRLFRPRGCSNCAGKGVKGRVGIYEVMRLTPELRQLIVKSVPAEELHAAAVAGGMIDLRRYASLVLAEG
jgi:type II secretory ATPase GspE/PulE/Tfp pilus assembly ATPase PilB-like protein